VAPPEVSAFPDGGTVADLEASGDVVLAKSSWRGSAKGIDKNIGHQARRLGELSDMEFEEKVSEAREAARRRPHTIDRQAIAVELPFRTRGVRRFSIRGLWPLRHCFAQLRCRIAVVERRLSLRVRCSVDEAFQADV
jgi:hypothetical protein